MKYLLLAGILCFSLPAYSNSTVALTCKSEDGTSIQLKKSGTLVTTAFTIAVDGVESEVSFTGPGVYQQFTTIVGKDVKMFVEKRTNLGVIRIGEKVLSIACQ